MVFEKQINFENKDFMFRFTPDILKIKATQFLNLTKEDIEYKHLSNIDGKIPTPAELNDTVGRIIGHIDSLTVNESILVHIIKGLNKNKDGRLRKGATFIIHKYDNTAYYGDKIMCLKAKAEDASTVTVSLVYYTFYY